GAAARNAVAAGAGAVVVYGDALPAGGIGLETPTPVPVVSVTAAVGRRIAAALARHERLGITIGVPQQEDNPARDAVASFSSRGLALSGQLKPELVARGVEIATTEPGV